VPVDFSESSLNALDYALSLAKRLKTTVTLLHVLEGVYGEGFLDAPLRVRERTRAIADARLKLHLLAASRVDRRVPMECVVRHGLVEYEILRMAEDGSVHLIVIGGMTRNALSRLVGGSVTKDVIEESPCPVIVVPERAANFARDFDECRFQLASPGVRTGGTSVMMRGTSAPASAPSRH
jgi:nucleotide-binding universal stress UspA family protein